MNVHLRRIIFCCFRSVLSHFQIKEPYWSYILKWAHTLWNIGDPSYLSDINYTYVVYEEWAHTYLVSSYSLVTRDSSLHSKLSCNQLLFENCASSIFRIWMNQNQSITSSVTKIQSTAFTKKTSKRSHYFVSNVAVTWKEHSFIVLSHLKNNKRHSQTRQRCGTMKA